MRRSSWAPSARSRSTTCTSRPRPATSACRIDAALAEGTVVVAVVAGEGNKALFRELGCHVVVDGGQSMNPSAAQLLEAVEALGAEEVVVLPNNGNVILTAEQAAGMSAEARRRGARRRRSPSASRPWWPSTPTAMPSAMRAPCRTPSRACIRPRSRVRCATRSSTVSRSARARPWASSTGVLWPPATSIEDAFGGVLEEFARVERSSSPSSRPSTGRA